MEVIDEEGDLFGVANVVDVLVVLVLLAVVVAGAAIVFGGGSESEGPTLATENVTLDLGQQPTYIAAAISEGDTHTAGGNSRLTVTDVHLSPQGGQQRVVVRARLRAPARGDSVRYANAPPRLGRSLDVATPRYRVSGRIRAVGGPNSLAGSETRVLVRDELATAEAEAIAPGDAIRVAGRTVATVRTVTTYRTSDPSTRRVFVGVALHTYRDGDAPRFGGRAVRRGQQIRLPADEYTLAGRLARVGSLSQPGSPATRTVTLRMGDVREAFAATLEPGMSEAGGDGTVARLTAVDTEPSPIIVRADDGSVNVADHPFLREVTLTAELRVRRTTDGLLFKGEPLQQGTEIVLDLGTVTVRATVVSVG